MRYMMNAYRFLVGNLEKWLPRKIWPKYEARIQIAFKKLWREDVKLIYQPLANTAMSVRVPEKDINILIC
jgi:hypothetical protein